MNIKLLSLFSGIGSFEHALKDLGIKYDIMGFSEIDKYAEKTYCTLYNVSSELNLGDITKIKKEEIPSSDMIIYGFPCQPFSIAGKKGGFDDYLNRGLMFFEALRIISISKPKICIAENVKNLKNFDKEFQFMLGSLKELGYYNYVIELNSKDYGSPQNRERIFIISVLDKNLYKDITLEKSKIKLSDLILPYEQVDSKEYISKEDNNFKEIDLAILEDFYKNRPVRIYKDYAPALRASRNGLKVVQNGRIRKLTVLEGFRLMGYSTLDYEQVKNINSKTQLWKQLGNSIDVEIAKKVLCKINFNEVRE